MAFTTTSNFAGKAAGFYISAALKEATSLDYLTKIENIKFKSNRSDRAKLRQRAEKVGLQQLPQGRPKEYIRKMWLEKLYKLEEEAKQKILDENK